MRREKTIGKTKSQLYVIMLLSVIVMSKIEAQIVIVVNENNPINNLSLDDLERIYLGKKTSFSNGERIILLQYEPLIKEFYEIVLNKTPMRVRKHWINVVLSGGSATPPQEYSIVRQTSELIAKNTGAISFIDFADVNKNYKVITIDGIKPDEPEYPLRYKK